MQQHYVLGNFGIGFGHPIMNAAGLCKKLEDVRELARSALAAIVVGSITVLSREINPGNTYWADKVFSLNSLGIPNPGKPYYQRHLPEMVSIAHDAGKVLILSVAGFSPKDFVELVELGLGARVDAVELNLSCPNIVYGEVQKPVICFDFNLVDRIINEVYRVAGKRKVLLKISPFSDPVARRHFGELVKGWPPVIGGLTLTNTLPNSFAFTESGEPAITPNNGFAGLAGPALRPIALAHVKEFSALLPDHDIIGVGGISSGRDVCDYMRAGAKAVQIATALLGMEGHLQLHLVGEILTEYVDLTEKEQVLETGRW